jgi:hypothetical protein
MAKKSKIARNEQRKVIVERYAAQRAALKKALVDPAGTDESREAARVGLQKLPRNASPSACAAATPSTAVPAVYSRNLAFHVSDSGIWHTTANCRELLSLLGKFGLPSHPGG